MRPSVPLQVLSRDDIRQLHLDQFEGPIDLLLALVRRRQVEVLEIPIATITADYLRCLEAMAADLSLEVSGDFLAMATALVYLKSQRLLPQATRADDQDDDGDGEEVVRDEHDLLARLSQLEQLRELGDVLWRRPLLDRDTFTRPEKVTVTPGRRPLAENIIELAEAFRSLVRHHTPRVIHERIERGLSLADAVRRILGHLKALATPEGRLAFRALLTPGEGRADAVALFQSLLELAKLRHVHLEQPDGGELLVGPGLQPPDGPHIERLLASYEAR